MYASNAASSRYVQTTAGTPSIAAPEARSVRREPRVRNSNTRVAHHAPAAESQCFALRIQRCIEFNACKLDLSDSGLTNETDLGRLIAPMTRIRSLNLARNSISRLPAVLPDGLVHLDISSNAFDRVPASLPCGLKLLNAAYNQIDEVANLPPGLELLNLEHNQIAALTHALPTQIRWLNLAGNAIGRLPDNLPMSLTHLDISMNALVRIPDDLPTGLKLLNAAHNRIADLPVLPDGLEQLNLKRNHISVLARALPARIKFLSLESNWLSRVDYRFPGQLRVLVLSNNLIREICSALPEKLEVLKLDRNESLTRLPDRLPPELKVLIANHCRLSGLPFYLPDTLGILEVRNNHIVVIRRFPANLIELDASQNCIVRIPGTLPNQVETIWLSENDIDYVPPFITRVQGARDALSCRIDAVPVRAGRPLKGLDLRGNPIALHLNGKGAHTLIARSSQSDSLRVHVGCADTPVARPQPSKRPIPNERVRENGAKKKVARVSCDLAWTVQTTD